MAVLLENIDLLCSYVVHSVVKFTACCSVDKNLLTISDDVTAKTAVMLIFGKVG